ncbi:hypothetical protein JMJ35_005772 [Cladonia borealis]|uniref:Aminoglycoside phosphotransferase domain-containing protein n=1 Tax=Cladonia borealis TaxID=184061 RepID=A0AA39QZ41_9LECA|nr:hypothetical protein JMJ35_005772 [Cladonia borealis]
MILTIELNHGPSQAASAMDQAWEDQGASSKGAFEPESVSRTQNVRPMDLQGLEASSLRGSTGSSRRTVSQTSTEEYCQIPFEEFSLQVKQLCEHLWGTQTYPEHDDSTAQVDTQSIASAEPSGYNEFVLEKMKGGGFNRVIGINVPDSQNRMVDINRFVLRIPRFNLARLDRDVAALRFVRKYTSIPVPEVVKYDFTKANPLHSPYIVQTRIQGQDLQANPGPNYYPNLSHNQKCTVAKGFGRILREIQSVEHSSPGLIEAASANESCQNYIVRHLDISALSHIEEEPDLTTMLPFFQPRVYGVSQNTSEEPSVEGNDFESSTYYFLLVQFGRLRASQLRRDPAMIGWCDNYERLVTMAKQMNELDLLGDDRYCLCHFDLNTAPRNIMARILPDESLVITGILDWDSAMFAPRFASCVPPMWIWSWASDGEDEDEFYANDTPANPEKQELKQLFEEAVGPAFLEYAYRPEYRLARTLLQFAIHGMRSTEDFKEMNSLLDDWAAMYEIYKKDYSDEGSDNISESVEAEGNKTAKELDDLEIGSNFGESQE